MRLIISPSRFRGQRETLSTILLHDLKSTQKQFVSRFFTFLFLGKHFQEALDKHVVCFQSSSYSYRSITLNQNFHPKSPQIILLKQSFAVKLFPRTMLPAENICCLILINKISFNSSQNAFPLKEGGERMK